MALASRVKIEINGQEVKDFFFSHYAPNNAILCVAGDVETDNVKLLAEKWFGNIERREIKKRNLPKEPKQIKAKELRVERDVPNDELVKAFHMCNRLDPDYQATDLISDLLSNGEHR